MQQYDSEKTQFERKLSELLDREQTERLRAEEALAVLRHTEARLSALFSSNVIGIIEFNETRVLDANESFLKMVDETHEAVLNGSLLWRDLVSERYRQIDKLSHEQAIREGSFSPFEEEFLARNGSPIPVWIGGVLLHPPPDWSCIAFVLDLTERKELEEQFHAGQKLKSLGLLSSVIAHDFNNLLTAMLGNASLALDALSPDHPAYGPIEEVARASRLASGLTDQLVGYSSKKRSKARLVELSELAREIGDLMELPLSRNVRIEWNLAPGLPHVSGDAYLIQQILMNLVINASDSFAETAGVIRIVTHCRGYGVPDLATMTMGANLPAGDYVSVEVHDNGCGMTDEVKAKIFDAMFTTKEKGRGLGLASTLGIVRSHRGAIHVRSKVGEGTCFTVLFPVSSELPDSLDEGEQEPDLQGHGTILVVDDEPSVRRLAETTLTRYGYTVILASGGEEGIEISRQKAESITLIIMDYSMPLMNGEQAVKRLSLNGSTPPVLFSSGLNASESMTDMAGFQFLRKPYTSRQLAERVKELHSRSR